MRELGEQRATGFLKKFYGWYLGHGRFPKPFKQELVQLQTTDEVITRLLRGGAGRRRARRAARGGAAGSPSDEVLLDQLPISIYGGG